jgi:hypothetical protein
MSDLACQILPKRARPALHAAAAVQLATCSGDRIRDEASMIAHHWRLAGELDSAVPLPIGLRVRRPSEGNGSRNRRRIPSRTGQRLVKEPTDPSCRGMPVRRLARSAVLKNPPESQARPGGGLRLGRVRRVRRRLAGSVLRRERRVTTNPNASPRWDSSIPRPELGHHGVFPCARVAAVVEVLHRVAMCGNA